MDLRVRQWAKPIMEDLASAVAIAQWMKCLGNACCFLAWQVGWQHLSLHFLLSVFNDSTGLSGVPSM